MNERNIGMEIFSIDSIVKAVEKEITNKKDLPDLEIYPEILSIVWSRKKLSTVPPMTLKANVDCILSVIPTESIVELKKKAKKKDPDALLAIADCYMFGLKEQKRKKNSSTYYWSAAYLNQPEAVTMAAHCCYQKLMDLASLPFGSSIPIVRVPSAFFTETKKQMWYWLEKALELDWVSPLMIKLAQDASQNGTSTLSYEMKRALIKRRIEAVEEMKENLQKNKFSSECFNPACTLKKSDKSNVINCERCINVKYCSADCQAKHWPKHNIECVDVSANIKNLLDTSKTKDSLKEKNESNKADNLSYKMMKIKLDKNLEINVTSSTLEADLLKHIDTHYSPTEIELKIIARTRLHSLPDKISSKDIETLGDNAFKKQKYSLAVKYFSLAIDKTQVDKRFYEMETSHLENLASIYAKRVDSYRNIGEKNRSIRHLDLALDDCIFVLETGVFNKKKISPKSIVIQNLKDTSEKIKEMKNVLEAERSSTSTQIERPRRGRRVRRNRRRNENQIQIKNSENDEYPAAYEPIKVTTCFQLARDKMALNAQIEFDQCPICITEWTNFIDPSFVAILPCSHACCVKCMIGFKKISIASQQEENEEDRQDSAFCVLCREEFSPSYLDDIAQSIAKEPLIESFDLLVNKLPFHKEEKEKLIISLLDINEFCVNKVENALFNLVGMIDTTNELDSNEKQEYFKNFIKLIKVAREPVNKLNEEYLKVKANLNRILDTDSKEWKNKNDQLKDIQQRLAVARQNAANDIFERVNSKGTMGVISSDSNETARIDLHGLFKAEAIEKFNQFVLPILPALGKVIIITGYGLHNESGEAVLKQALTDYLDSISIKWKQSVGNKGMICVYAPLVL